MYMSGVNYVIDENGIAGEEYSYDADGHLIAVTYLNSSGSKAANRKGVAGLRLKYDEFGNCIYYSYVNSDDEPSAGPELFDSAEITWDNNGKICTTLYKDAKGQAVVNTYGYAKKVCEYDSANFLIRESYYGVDDEAVFSTDGYHGINFTRNDAGDVEEEQYIGFSGNAVENNLGYARVKHKCDESGNELKVSYFNSEDKPVALEDCAASVEQIIDDGGYITDQYYFDTEGKPVITKSGFCHRAITLDDKNQPVEISYFGIDEKPVYCVEGYHKLSFEYDKLGNMIKLSVYGTEGQLIPFDGSWAVKERWYNGGGDIVSEKLLDQYGKPVTGTNQYASLENEYDDRGLLISTSFYDENGKLKDGNSESAASNRISVGSRHYARIEFAYDDDGNVVECSEYGEDGNLIDENLGYASWKAEYDAYGREIRKSWLYANGKPYEKCAYLTREYDEHGNETKTHMYRSDGEPALVYTQDGVKYSATEKVFDECRHELECSYYQGNDLVKTVIHEYNDNGLLTKEISVDSNDVPFVSGDGTAGTIINYDDQRRVTDKTFVSGSSLDELVTVESDNEGYAREEREYDDDGRKTTVTYYDAKGNMTCNNHGFAQLVDLVDERRNTVKADFYYSDGGLLFSFENKYNTRGQYESKAVYRGDGNLLAVSSSNLVAKIENTYDEYGNRIGMIAYGEDGNPVSLGEYSSWQSEYDEQNREKLRKYIGSDGKPVMISGGFAEASFEYDEYGREIKRSFFDTEEKPVNTIFGFAGYEVSYSDSGRILSCKYFDANGKEVAVKNGEVKIETLMIGGDYEIRSSYSPKDGSKMQSIQTENMSSVNRLCYLSDDNQYDLLLQPFIPVGSGTQIAEYAQKAKKYYTPGSGGNASRESSDSGLDLSTYEDGETWTKIVQAYVDAIESDDGNAFAALLNMEANAIAADYYREQLGYEVSAEELTKFYTDFYKSELSKLHREIEDCCGSSFDISWKITNVKETSKKEIEAANSQFAAMAVGDNEAPLFEDNITLSITYKAEGENGTVKPSTGYLYPELVIQKINGKWLVGTSSGFPSIPKDDLEKFLG